MLNTDSGMTEATKDLYATLLGAVASIFTYATGLLKILTLGVPVSVLNPEFGFTLFTAFLVGIAGALGGLITRETYKFIVKEIKKFKERKNKKTEDWL
jgi:uncharacterized membrane protein